MDYSILQDGQVRCQTCPAVVLESMTWEVKRKVNLLVDNNIVVTKARLKVCAGCMAVLREQGVEPEGAKGRVLTFPRKIS